MMHGELMFGYPQCLYIIGLVYVCHTLHLGNHALTERPTILQDFYKCSMELVDITLQNCGSLVFENRNIMHINLRLLNIRQQTFFMLKYRNLYQQLLN